MEQWQSIAIVIRLEFFEPCDKHKKKGPEASRVMLPQLLIRALLCRLVAKQKFLGVFEYRTTDFVMEW